MTVQKLSVNIEQNNELTYTKLSTNIPYTQHYCTWNEMCDESDVCHGLSYAKDQV